MKRGIDDFNIEDGESEQIDHLLFMIHGIGKGKNYAPLSPSYLNPFRLRL